MTLQYKLTTGIAAIALMAFMMTGGAFAATKAKIVKNGADSENKIKISKSSVTAVSQSNNTFVVNAIGVSSNTGGNSANKNTGGNTSLKTGKVKTNVSTSVTGSSNYATVNTCCKDGDYKFTIKKNGADSDNEIDVENNSVFYASQSNNTAVVNLIGVESNTGYNEANKNTDGDVDLKTGKVDTDVTTRVTGSTNALDASGCCEDEECEEEEVEVIE